MTSARAMAKLVLMGALLMFTTQAMAQTAPANAAEEGPAETQKTGAELPAITIATAHREKVEARVSVTGSMVARKEVMVNANVSGYEITAIEAEIGDSVKAGDVLARLSSATLTALLQQAEAEFQRAEAGVSQSESQLASSEASLTQAVQTLERTQSLRRSGNAPQATLDQAIAAEASARAAVASANDGIGVARAALAQATAAREVARLNLGYATIAAPVDGVVVQRSAELGAISGAGTQALFTLIANSEVEFAGEVVETALGQLEPGQAVELTVAGIGQIEGSLRLVPASVDMATRLGAVRVSLEADPRLRTGLFASGWIVTAKRDSVTVPVTAVLADDSGERVQIVKGDEIESRPVKAGLIWQGQREILEGVAEGEDVVARAGAFFRTGDRIRPVRAEAAATPASPTAEANAGTGE